jgi:uncharacterized protein (DUF952 family)
LIERRRTKQDSEDLIVHICQREAWEEAKRRGVYQAPSLDSEGFIHCSRVDQILKVANTFYRDVPDLIVLWIDPLKVKSEIRWETVGEEAFPHVYGLLEIDAVVKVSDLIPEEDNYFRSL